jgi:hypothetical protein
MSVFQILWRFNWVSACGIFIYAPNPFASFHQSIN